MSTPQFVSNEIKHKVPAFWKRTIYNTKIMVPYAIKKNLLFQRSTPRPETIQGPPVLSYVEPTSDIKA
jgi:hypothetical protein